MRGLIGVTGGIGSGKSVVCRVCALRGAAVYDCDARAKAIMDSSDEIKQALRSIAGDCVVDGCGVIDRMELARRLFADAQVRLAVNALVHQAVRDDIEAWVRQVGDRPAIVESAIMHTAGLDRLVERIWLVEAPEQVRVERVMARSGLTREQARARIESQRAEFDALPQEKVIRICNDGIAPLLSQIPAF
mgnify:CR=1 FL=1